MKKIATHDSASGEKGLWYCIPLIPFARTQSKTIKEQYEAGCRQFDIRVKYHAGEWRCAHGWFFTKKTAYEIFAELDSFDEPVQVAITYEGRGGHKKEFMDFVNIIKKNYTNIIYGGIALKYGSQSTGVKVKYELLEKSECGFEGGVQGFLPLDGRSWHTYLPIPWLWDRLYKRPHDFNEEKFIYVDFL